MERGGWGLNGLSLKALLHEAIFPATCSATGDDSTARQVAEYMFHAGTYLATLQKVDTWSTLPATRNKIFHCETCCKEGVLHTQFRLQLVLQSCRKITLCHSTLMDKHH